MLPQFHNFLMRKKNSKCLTDKFNLDLKTYRELMYFNNKLAKEK